MRLRQLSLTIFLLIMVSSCIAYTRSASDDNYLWGEYQQDKIYVVERDIFLMRKGLLHLYLIPESSYKGRTLGRHYLAPESIQEYERDPQKASRYKIDDSLTIHMNVVGIIRAGTEIKVTEMKKRSGWTFYFGGFEEVIPYATIMSGPYSGKVVDITDVSIYYRNSENEIFRYKPETGVIKLL